MHHLTFCLIMSILHRDVVACSLWSASTSQGRRRRIRARGASWSTADCEGFHKRDLPLVIHAARGTRHVASSSSLHIAGLSESLPRPATTENCCAELNTGDSFVKRENVLQSV
ncbi:hypothetical protein PF004_g28540 [Phytophthora fragariae]|uniref:Secreted protein n=1 Tax=Phytophthora fragariae TaxID=53985 RepID=A0A6G0MHE1_9STRA|nr:hypothetical protein PF004_g28540 [Phytophthora fragariae]